MKGKKIIIFLFLVLSIDKSYSILIEEPPIYKNAKVSTSKDCIFWDIRKNYDWKPVLRILSRCDEKYIYIKENKKIVLVNDSIDNIRWWSKEVEKKDITINYVVWDANITMDAWNFSTKLVNYNNENDVIEIKWKVYYDDNYKKQVKLEKVNSSCINASIKEFFKWSWPELNITSNCKEKYLYTGKYWTEKILLVNSKDYESKDGWWKSLINELNEKYSFYLQNVIRDNSINENKWFFEKKLVNYYDKNDIVKIKWVISWNSYVSNKLISIILLIITIIIIVYYKKFFKKKIKN